MRNTDEVTPLMFPFTSTYARRLIHNSMCHVFPGGNVDNINYEPSLNLLLLTTWTNEILESVPEATGTKVAKQLNAVTPYNKC